MATVMDVSDQLGDSDAAELPQSGPGLDSGDPVFTDPADAPPRVIRDDAEVDAQDSEDLKPVVSAKPTKKKRTVFGVIRLATSLLMTAAMIFFMWPPAWGGFFTVAIVSGESMEPTYHTGDVVVAVKSLSGYQVGDVIVYTVDQDGIKGNVVHRISAELPNGNFITQGDNKPSPDPWEVPPSWIKGEVKSMVPQGAQILLIVRSPVFLAIICGLLVTAALWPRKKEEDEPTEVAAACDEPDASGESGADSQAEMDPAKIKGSDLSAPSNSDSAPQT